MLFAPLPSKRCNLPDMCMCCQDVSNNVFFNQPEGTEMVQRELTFLSSCSRCTARSVGDSVAPSMTPSAAEQDSASPLRPCMCCAKSPALITVPGMTDGVAGDCGVPAPASMVLSSIPSVPGRGRRVSAYTRLVLHVYIDHLY
jgi:hypothetical protein